MYIGVTVVKNRGSPRNRIHLISTPPTNSSILINPPPPPASCAWGGSPRNRPLRRAGRRRRRPRRRSSAGWRLSRSVCCLCFWVGGWVWLYVVFGGGRVGVPQYTNGHMHAHFHSTVNDQSRNRACVCAPCLGDLVKYSAASAAGARATYVFGLVCGTRVRNKKKQHRTLCTYTHMIQKTQSTNQPTNQSNSPWRTRECRPQGTVPARCAPPLGDSTPS